MRIRLILGLLFLLGAAPSVFAQGGLIQLNSIVVTGAGQPVAGARVTVCTIDATGIPCTPTVTVYKDIALTMPITPVAPVAPSQVVTDGLGNIPGYVPSGEYTVTVTGQNIRPTTYKISVGGGGGGGSCPAMSVPNLAQLYNNAGVCAGEDWTYFAAGDPNFDAGGDILAPQSLGPGQPGPFGVISTTMDPNYYDINGQYVHCEDCWEARLTYDDLNFNYFDPDTMMAGGLLDLNAAMGDLHIAQGGSDSAAHYTFGSMYFIDTLGAFGGYFISADSESAFSTEIRLFDSTGDGNYTALKGPETLGITPNPICFPTTNSTAGQTLVSDGGTSPCQQLSWGAGGGGLSLETDGTPNGSQSLLNLAAGSNVTLVDNGTGTVTIAASGSGGSTTPGGSSGQIQYNAAGVFGGFTMAKDCTFSQPNITCTKTNNVAFAASATTDTTNAANISSGNLAVARLNGGTGATSSTFWRGDGSWATPAGGGTVTSIATTAPLGGGTITSTGTLTCTTCVVATSPGAGIAHFAGSTQTVTSSAVNLATGDVTGNLGVAHLNSGTSATSSTFWRGDGSWATPPGGITGTITQHAFVIGASSTTITPGCTPPTVNGSYFPVYQVTGSAAVDPTCPIAGMTAVPLSGATSTDTVTYAYNETTVLHDVAGSASITETLPTPTTLGNARFTFRYTNHSSHTDTISATTFNIQNGVHSAASTLSVPTSTSCQLYIDPTNANTWSADCVTLQ